MQTPSPPAKLFGSTLTHLVDTLGLREVHGDDGGPWKMLPSHAPFHQGPCGNVRRFEGSPIFQIVTCSLVAPAIQLDSHMMFAFSPSDSAMPHFTLDSVMTGDQFAFHLDLIPRVDLATSFDYMKWAFVPLSDTYAAAEKTEGLVRANITPMQRAIMSPWMLVYRANQSAFEEITPHVRAYADHWLGLVRAGVPAGIAGGLTGAQLAQRDAANKDLIFDPEIDKVWNQIRGLIGSDAVDDIRGLLKMTSSAG